MKKSLLTVAAALIALGASAQSSILVNPDNKAYFGVRASLDITCPGDVKEGNYKTSVYSSGVGFSVGAIYNRPLVANLYVEPGVSLYYNTFSYKEPVLRDELDQLLGSDFPAGTDIKNNSFREFGMRIPITVGYHFDFANDLSIAVYTGPEFNIGFSCDYYLTMEYKGEEVHAAYTQYRDGGFDRFDCAWQFGVGATYCGRYYLGVGGSIGMLDIAKDSKNYKPEWHKNRVSITLGYNF